MIGCHVQFGIMVNESIAAALSFTSPMPDCSWRGQRWGQSRSCVFVSDGLGGWSVWWPQLLWIQRGFFPASLDAKINVQKMQKWRDSGGINREWRTGERKGIWHFPTLQQDRDQRGDEEEVRSLEPSALLWFTVSCSSSDTELPPPLLAPSSFAADT